MFLLRVAFSAVRVRLSRKGIRIANLSAVVGSGDLVLCVNAAPTPVTGEAVPLFAGETCRVYAFVWAYLNFMNAKIAPPRVSAMAGHTRYKR